MRQGLKSLTEYFGKQKIRTIQHGDIEALKLHLIRKPTRAGQKTDGGGSQGASVSSGGVEFCFSERLDESSPFGAANGKKLINLSAEKNHRCNSHSTNAG